MTLLFLFLVCLLASTVGGVCGIGGGVVIKPVLDATGIMNVSAASFLSGLTVIAMSMVSVYKNRKTRELDPVRSVPIGLGAAVGGVLGKRLFVFVKEASGREQLAAFAQAVLLGVLVLGGSVPAFSPAALCAMVLAGVSGGFISARLHKRLSARQTERLFVALLCVILAVCAYNALRALG